MLLLHGNHNSEIWLQITILIYQQKYEIMKHVHHNRPLIWWYTLHRFTGGSHHKYQWCGIFILSLLIKITSSNGNIFRVIGLCGGNSPVTGELLPLRPVARNFDVFVDCCCNCVYALRQNGVHSSCTYYETHDLNVEQVVIVAVKQNCKHMRLFDPLSLTTFLSRSKSDDWFVWLIFDSYIFFVQHDTYLLGYIKICEEIMFPQFRWEL